MNPWVLRGLLCLAIVAGAWRFVKLDRDPDVVTETSQEAWGDPAYYLYNARSRVLSGEWRVEEGVAMYVSPGYTFAAAAVFALFGVHFTNAILLALLSGFVVIGATAMIAECGARAERNLPPWLAGGAALVMLLGSYVFCAHQRVPNGDMEALAIASLSALCFVRLQETDFRVSPMMFRILAVLAGIGIGLSPFIKLNNIIFSAAAVAAWISSYFLLEPEWRHRWRAATPWLAAGILSALALWLVWAVWANRLSAAGELSRQFGRLRIYSLWTAAAMDKGLDSKSGFSLFRYFQSNLMYRQPVEVVLATIGLVCLLAERRGNWPLLFCGVWWMTGIAAMAIVTPDPLRYRLVVWPAVVVLAAHLWARLAAGAWLRAEGILRNAAALTLGVVLGVVGLYLANYKLHNAIPAQIQVLFVVVSIFTAFLVLRILNTLPSVACATLLMASVVAVSLPQWISGERRASHELQDAALRLERYPETIVLGGGWGVRLGFSTPRNAYFFWTPPARDRVNLFVEDPLYLKDIPVAWHEAERHGMKRLPLEIVFAEIDR